jgi:hypothetical protein
MPILPFDVSSFVRPLLIILLIGIIIVGAIRAHRRDMSGIVGRIAVSFPVLAFYHTLLMKAGSSLIDTLIPTLLCLGEIILIWGIEIKKKEHFPSWNPSALLPPPTATHKENRTGPQYVHLSPYDRLLLQTITDREDDKDGIEIYDPNTDPDNFPNGLPSDGDD